MKELKPPGVVVRADASLADLARRINAEYERHEAAQRASVKHALALGQMLLEVKRQVGHGGWLAWLKANVPFSERKARNYARLAREWPALEAKSAGPADLSIEGALALLSAKDD